jgi:hypothetical protein
MMGNFIGILLYVTGYTYDYKENINDPPLAIRSGANNTYMTREVSSNKKGCMAQLPGNTYNAFIVLIMIWRAFYAIYMSIRDKDIVPFGRVIFQILLVMQYILGIMYFRKQHFYKNISTKSDMINLLRVSAPFTIVISLSLAIVHTTLMVNDVNIHGYSEIYDSASGVSAVLLAILLFVDTLYSYLTFTINTCVFVINMVYHKQKVSEYATSLNDEYIRSDQDDTTKVNTIAKGYSLMKDLWDETVTVLNPFFTSLNFVGFVSIYFYVRAIKDNDISADEITNLILFVIVEVIYIISIQTVYKSISRISDATGSTPLVAMYFADDEDDVHTLQSMAGQMQRLDVEMGMVKDSMRNVAIKTRQSRRDSHTSGMTDGSNCMDTDSDSTGPNAHNDNDNHNKDGKTYNFDDLHLPGNNDHPDEVYMTDPNLSASMRNVMTTVNGVQNMVNWMALQGITSAQWKTFRLFGIQLTDATLISRLFGLATTLLITAELGSTLNWW